MMLRTAIVLLALVAACMALGPGVYQNPIPKSELFFFGNDLVVWVPNFGMEVTVDLDEAVYQCTIATNPKADGGFRLCTNVELIILSEQTNYADSLINECFWSFERANQNSIGMFCFADQYDPSKWVAKRVFSLDDVFASKINGLSRQQLNNYDISLSSGESYHTSDMPGAYVACCASATYHQVQDAAEPQGGMADL